MVIAREILGRDCIEPLPANWGQNWGQELGSGLYNFILAFLGQVEV
jgi:hypothetical protein